MRVVSWEYFQEDYEASLPMAATIGVFDGLHIGHRALLEGVLAHGRDSRSGRPRVKAVFSFATSPKLVLRPSAWQGELSSLSQRVELLEAWGLDLLVLIDFSGNFSKLAGRDFLTQLWERGSLEYLAIGSNFCCGHGLDTKAKDIPGFLAPRGVETEVVEPVLWAGEAVSSSRIRKALVQGQLAEVTGMLGRNYEVDLRPLESTAAPGSAMAFRRPRDLVLPPAGCYQVEAKGKGRLAQGQLTITSDRLELHGEFGFEVASISLTKVSKT